MTDIAYWTAFAVINIVSLRALWQRSRGRRTQQTLRWPAWASLILAVLGIVGRATETLGVIGESFDPSQRAVRLVPAWWWYLLLVVFAALPILTAPKASMDLGDVGDA